MVRLNTAGSALEYATFLGGSGDDRGHGIAVDGRGVASVTGFAGSSDFPATCGAFDTSLGGSGDAFVVMLDMAGSALKYATFLGGSTFDEGEGIAVDGRGVAYVTGNTRSSDSPITPGAFDTSYNGGEHGDVFMVKLAMEPLHCVCIYLPLVMRNR